ncbi:hypothetical protein ABW20_dc0102723 [Dactylellina cionopaga]|nr:hypothetical protein ABW20_dc0102723 [Dactylellina cionopaga]
MAPPRVQWTHEADRRLLLAVIASTPNLDIKTVAFHGGFTTNNVSWRFHVLKKEAAQLRIKSECGELTPTPSKKRAVPSSDSPSPSLGKKRKLAAKKKKALFEDTSDEEPLTPKFDGESESEETPSLHDDEGEETGPSSIEPESVATKVLPRRKVKLEPGAYKRLAGVSDSSEEDY